MKFRILLFAFVFFSGFTTVSYGQLAIPNATTVTQNFDGISSSATAALPTGFVVNSGPNTGDYSTGTVLTTIAYGTTGAGAVTSTSGGGVINWANGITASSTDRAIGFLTSGSFSSPRSILVAIQNTGTTNITDLSITFDYEKYRSGVRAFNWTFFHGATATAVNTAASVGDQAYVADANNTTVYNPPTTTSKSVTLTGLNIVPSGLYYLCWTYTGVGGSTNGQGIGVDNLSITATFIPAGIESIATGNWSNPATWTGGNVPDSNENAIIKSGHKVTVDSAIYNVRDAGTTTTVDSGGTLATAAFTYTNNGTTTINGTFEINSGGYANGLALSFGTNGTLNFNTGGTYLVDNLHTYWPPVVSPPKNVNIASGTSVIMAANAYRVIAIGGTLSIAGTLTLITNPTITVNGTLRLDAGGYLNAGTMPIYGSASTLLYNTGGNYGRGFEWNAAGVGVIGSTQGYPNHVQVSNNTTINYINGAASGAVGSKAIAGNLTIDAGSALHMDYGSVSAGGELIVAGNIANAGTLTLGFAVGDDLRLSGNLTNSGTFNGNNRAVYFNRTGTQVVTSSTALTIPYVRTAGTGTTVQLAVGTNITVSAGLGGDAIVFGNAADVIDINTTNTLTIGTNLIANTINGLGTFKGSTSSNLTLRGTGSIGTLNFTTGFQNLGTFTMNRQNGVVGCVMGTSVTINTALVLTAGLVDLNTTTMILLSTVAIPAGSANSYVIADVSVGGVLRKNITAIGSYAFPVGSGGTQFTPATVNLTAGTFSGAYLGIAVENSKHPDMDAPTTYLNRYWSVTSAGITTPIYTFTGTYISGVFPAGDVTGGTAGNIANQWNGVAWLNNGSGSIAGTVVITGATTLPTINHFSAGTRNAEINIRHVATDVVSGSTFTNFGTVVLNGAAATVTFTVQNLGQQNLLLGTATLTGANYSTNYSFTAGSPGSVSGSGSTTFTISVNPTSLGLLAGSISIVNNDLNENPYVINFECTVVCPTIAITSVTPTSGPVGTVVTINASGGDLSGTTVNFGGVAATISSASSTQLVVTVPEGAVTGNINITKTATGCLSSTAYTVINVTGTCNGLTNLIMTEIYDQDGASLGYVEVYNGTGNTIDLSTYYIRRYADNASFVANTYTDYTFAPGITSIANGAVKYGRISTDPNTASPDFDFSTPGFAGINGDDIFHLYQGSTLVDVYIVPNATIGYTAKRNTNTAGPNTTSNPSDWTHTNTETLADLGTFVYNGPLSTIPTVTTDPVDVTTCNTTATFTAGATPGPGAGTLTYQWYYNSGTALGWTAVGASSLTGVTATNFNTNTLTLTGAIGAFSGYQFYCQVSQNTTCNAASDAAQLIVAATVWSGTAWSNGTPNLTTGVVIAGNYDTATNGSFEACSVTVNPSVTLDIKAADYVAIQNNLFVNAGGTLLVQNNGSLVMIDDAGVVTNNGTTNVIRTTAPFELYDYTYWSSPVNSANISSTFTGWRTDYSFEFNAANYSDTNTIDYYGTVTAAGVADSFDDFAPWAWLPYTGNMTNGKGYAIMGPTGLVFGPSATTTVTFSGAVNNGVVPISIVESGNVANTADDFNLIGNPYPSGIFADDFIITNGTKTSGSLYFWTHVDDVSVTNPGPSLYNFITDDYAVYNLSGGTRASFTGSVLPTGYIASGQGFFVEAQGDNTLTFNNAMRDKDYDNTQFFRTAQPQAAEKDRLWLNLRNSDGMFGQLLVGYLPGSTLDFDWAYDARVNQSNNYLSFYTLGNNEKYKIQARSNFVESDIVPIGYFSSVDGEFSISIDQQEGVLNNEEINIYVEDLELNIIHDLKASPYTFTTTSGKFDNRFLLRYTDGSALDNPDSATLNNSVVVASNQGELTIKSYLQTIDEVLVYDVLGRQLYQAKGIGANDFRASNVSLSQQSLIVKIKLESGTIVTKKILL
jgi:hypothetical protein